jgi:hypothetical protein
MPAQDPRTVPPPADLVPCPCCHHPTLRERANFEICAECGWEDDGQDDDDAHVVRGGPNGRLTLAQARLDYLKAIADEPDESSVARGGDGLWWTAARSEIPDLAD